MGLLSFRRARHAVAIAALVGSAFSTGLAPADAANGQGSDKEPARDRPAAPSGTVNAVMEREATLDQMQADEASRPAAATQSHDAGALSQGSEARPTAAQAAARDKAAQAVTASAGSPEASADSNAPPGTLVTAFDGFSRATAGGFPPDSDGAVGTLHYVEVVNFRLRVYNKANNAVLNDVGLATFFNDADTMFDPRCVYDQTYKRYVCMATRRADSGTDPNRYIKVAVSNNAQGNANGSWIIFRLNFAGSDGEWCDYPQLGIGQDEVLFTCNNFDDSPGGFVRTMVFAMSKARFYNGWGVSFPIFSPANTFSIAPPVVTGTPQQQNNNLYFLTTDQANAQIDLYRMTNGAHPGQTTFVQQADIAVPAFSQPFDAFNCGGGGPTGAPATVDALEGRFQQNSWQNDNSNSIWNVHSEAIGGWITPVYFQINFATNSVTRRGVIDTSDAGSDEFNAAIAVNGADQMFAVWTRTSTTSNPCLAVQRGGCEVTADCDANIGDTSIFHANGAGPVNNIDSAGRNRWGDYSTVEPDPSPGGASCGANKRAWANIEYTNANDGQWDDRILKYGFC